MILEIDIGNTWAKWRLVDAQRVVVRGKTRSTDFPQQDVLSLKGIHGVRLASVIALSDMGKITSALAAAFGVTAQCAESLPSQAGVINAYQNPSSMGVDRWLAMLAAYNQMPVDTAKRGCLVVSCGTAVTIDFVRADGVHEGGYILPGLMLMRDALLSRTGRIQYSPSSFEMLKTPGDSTARAVEHGAVFAVLSAIECASVEVTQRWGGGEIFLTGGDAQSLCSLLKVPSRYIEELVLDGLQYALL